jgi:hypothetical protein
MERVFVDDALPSSAARIYLSIDNIYLKAAKQIGMTILPNVLARADRVIK